jgi:hypothetical protein
MPCHSEKVYRRFGEKYYLHLQGRRVGQASMKQRLNSAFTRLHGVIIQKIGSFITTAVRTPNPTHCLSCFSGDTATCLYNSPHEDESLPRVLPGKLLTLDAQCRKDRGTTACFVSLLISSTKYYRAVVLNLF